MKERKLEGEKLVKYLEETYGKILSLSDIQMQDCRFDITAETEKKRTVYFKTGGGDEDYRYFVTSLSWDEHVYGGLDLDRFTEIPFGKPVPSEYKPYRRCAKQMYKKYGKILSIKITSSYKYVVNGEMTVEKSDKPLKICLSRWYDEYCKIDTSKLDWDEFLPEQSAPFIEESSSDSSSESDNEE